MFSSTCFEPGAMTKLSLGCAFFPFRIFATVIRSLYDEFVQLPRHTWSTSIPSSSFTVLMFPGLCGYAASGISSLRSRSTILSYSASGSAFISTQSFSRSWALRNAFVVSSLGKIDVVTPHSAPIFVIVSLSGTDNVFTPSPPYSNTQPTLPLVVNSSSIFKTTSFAVTQDLSLPVKFTLITLGQVR